VGGWRRTVAPGNCLLLVEGGGPSDDKPTVTFEAPPGRDRVSASFTIHVPDCRGAYETLKARGAAFLTPPVDHGREGRAFFRDPDGHLFEISEYVPQRSEPVDPSDVQALTFDVFGTVVGWPHLRRPGGGAHRGLRGGSRPTGSRSPIAGAPAISRRAVVPKRRRDGARLHGPSESAEGVVLPRASAVFT